MGFASIVSNTFVSNLGSSLVKQEAQEAAKQILIATQESQKDFLFDPYAAAYYERF